MNPTKESAHPPTNDGRRVGGDTSCVMVRVTCDVCDVCQVHVDVDLRVVSVGVMTLLRDVVVVRRPSDRPSVVSQSVTVTHSQFTVCWWFD